MQTNFQGRRERFEPKTAAVSTELNTRSNRRGLRTEGHLIDEAAPADVMKNFVSGVVTSCLKLNVRKAPSADGEVLTIIDASSKVMVDVDSSTEQFYKVFTEASIEGFCMKKYITLKK